MIKFIGHIYWLFLPVIAGGVLNMIFVKLPILRFMRKPMDGGRTYKGKRIFGDNKTWKGFFGMIVLTGLSALLIWGDFLFGAWLGLGYAIAELPNSFIKRRIGIKEGKSGGFIATLFDQMDSVIGCIVFYPLFYPLTWQETLGILTVGTATHYIVNILLFYAKLKKQRG